VGDDAVECFRVWFDDDTSKVVCVDDRNVVSGGEEVGHGGFAC
jgi:hypothetical protein